MVEVISKLRQETADDYRHRAPGNLSVTREGDMDANLKMAALEGFGHYPLNSSRLARLLRGWKPAPGLAMLFFDSAGYALFAALFIDHLNIAHIALYGFYYHHK